jgi:hypothetical protein
MNLTNSQLTALRKFSGFKAGWKNIDETYKSLELKKCEHETGSSRQPEFTRQRSGKARATEI